MTKAKQQPDNDQISVDPNDPDVRAFAATGSLAADEQPCKPGFHWDGQQCVPDDVVIVD